jgi:hypothetical protein
MAAHIAAPRRSQELVVVTSKTMARWQWLLVATAVACGGREAPKQVSSGWAPGVVLASAHQGPRGLVDLRGIIHAHSVYSHDACDNAPRDPKTGALDSTCFDDFRRGLCQARHDFVMLTDHAAHHVEYEYPDVLLYRAELGDALIDRAGPVANRAGCSGSAAAGPLIMSGSETGAMPIGLERHPGKTAAERNAAYKATTAEGIALLKQAGAVVLAQHTEQWSPQQLVSLGFDGFEMYNLHANAILGAGGVLAVAKAAADPEAMPASDLALLPIINEDPAYLTRWGTVLAMGARRVTTAGTDCHRNSFKTLLPDGERIDSYRRMMQWFSNHLLVRASETAWNDRDLKDAMRAGRLYAAFEVMGYPEAFDYRGEEGAKVREMGETLSIAAGGELVVSRPRVRDLASDVSLPAIRSVLLRAKDGGWDVVADGEGDELRFKPSKPGAYRAEVRMRPRHLRASLKSFADLADKDFVWIYANAIYVE